MDIDRNTIEGFAERTRKNLHFIVTAHKGGDDVHVITQLINSLLGLIVYPVEYYGRERFDDLPLSEIYPESCPWDFSPVKGLVERSFIPPTSIGNLLQHVRNGIAHRHIHFGSTSRHLEEVDVTFWDRRYNRKKKLFEAPHWCARINAAELERFTEMLATAIEGSR